jgi:aspartate aminotransferase
MAVGARLEGIQLSGIRKMFELTTEESVNLGLGEPDFQPAEHIKQAITDAVNNGHNKYGPTGGIPQLREAIAENARNYRNDITLSDVVVTTGSTQALNIIAQYLFNQGDDVLLPDPGFVLNVPQVKISGAQPIMYPLKQEYDFVPQIEDLERLITPKTVALYTNSPSNPTGGVIPKDDIKRITQFAEDHDLWIVSDEVYDKMVYDQGHESFLGDYEKVIHVNSLSKTYAMTGWRFGFLITKAPIIEKLTILNYYTIACPNLPVQHAAFAALTGPQEHVIDMMNEFKKRRDLIVERLNKIEGIDCRLPKGAFYAFPKYEYNIKSLDFAMECAKADLICTHGEAFGDAGEGHMRFSYANSLDNINRGMDIFEEVCSRLMTKAI